ncbi:MAG: hypothetical protein ACOVS5_05600 [Oligoflexus sp.]
MLIRSVALVVPFLLLGCGQEPPPKPNLRSAQELTSPAQPSPGSPGPAAPLPGSPSVVVVPEEGGGEAKQPELPSPVTVAPELESAIQAAHLGPKLTGIDLYGQKWNIERATVSENGTVVTITGRVSRHRPAGPGDQIDYRLSIDAGKITQQEFKIDQGGISKLLPLVKPLLQLVEQFSGSPIPLTRLADALEAIVKELESQNNDDWEPVANQFATVLALEVYSRHIQSF